MSSTNRLIDQDLNVCVYTKKVIVVGDISPATIAVGNALKALGHSVYDLDATCDIHEVKRGDKVITKFENHHRDWPLWIEAAQAKLDGNPYGQEEFDKLTGRYTAIAAGPASVFTNDLIKTYPYAKIIVVNTNTPVIPKKHSMKVNFLARHDPSKVFSNIVAFSKIAEKIVDPIDLSDVPSAKVLRVNQLNLQELCTFLGCPRPIHPVSDVAPLSDKLSARAAVVYDDYKNTVFAHLLYLTISLCVGSAVLFLVKDLVSVKKAAFADAVTTCCFLAAVHLHNTRKTVATEPKIASTETTTVPAKSTVTPTKTAAAPAKPETKRRQDTRNNKSKFNNKKPSGSNKKPGQQRAWSPPVERAPRPARPVAAGWQNFHYDIARDDYQKYVAKEAAKATEGINPNVVEHDYTWRPRKHE